MGDRILEIKDLRFSFDTYSGEVQAVRGVSLHIDRGETLAIVGESGCGKSVTVQCVMKLVPTPPGRLKGGEICYCGKDITRASQKEMQSLRGSEMSMIFQDPMTSLNPTMRVGRQIAEGILMHESISRFQAEKRTIDLLKKVGIPNAEKNVERYPHQFSGGMRQRVMIAMALACNPKILFADEPTTALDVTTQAQILELMNNLKKEFNTSIVIITHDLGVVARVAQRIAVMYAGKIVETGSARDIFYQPRHPYTLGLLESMPGSENNCGKKLASIRGTPPDLFAPPAGCGFAPRCKYCMNICRDSEPDEAVLDNGHKVVCWLLHEQAPKQVLPVRKCSLDTRASLEEVF
jgi:oligopeptide/dipeptide ABC transporter, ATP-binding protein, C-terminal domain